ncbi:MAG TPA: cytochrome c [Steroidobacteraceae bacterium]|nr:cytochrome c [Steroidobacteraceae bacterium]
MIRPCPCLGAFALALAVVLAACSPSASGGGARAPEPIPNRGAQLYDGNCVACHQKNGGGIPNVYPSLAGSAIVLGDPQVLARWIVRGERPASRAAGGYPTAMPRFGWMSPADVAALATFLRSSFGNNAPPVSADSLHAALEGS